MRTHQAKPRSGEEGSESARSKDETVNTDEKMINQEISDRKRAEYLRLHDDDEAEIDLPRSQPEAGNR